MRKESPPWGTEFARTGTLWAVSDTEPREEWRQAKWIAIYASTLSLAAQDERKAKKRWLTTVEMWILRAGAAAFADEATADDAPHSSGSNSASNST